MCKLLLPDEINQYLLNMECEQNSIGCSQANVYKFTSKSQTYYLKIESKLGYLKQEYEKMLWLQDKIPVPKIIKWYSDSQNDYLLMTEINGKIACDDYYKNNPLETVSVLAKGIKALHSIDIKQCPFYNDLNRKLKLASDNVNLNQVDMADWEQSTKDNFSSPKSLLEYLNENKPEEELVFNHGDYCLANVFGNGDMFSGFIDINTAGIADIWQDIALCIRSLRHNFNTERYDNLLLEQIGVTMNKQKFDYYILLDDLF